MTETRVPVQFTYLVGTYITFYCQSHECVEVYGFESTNVKNLELRVTFSFGVEDTQGGTICEKTFGVPVYFHRTISGRMSYEIAWDEVPESLVYTTADNNVVSDRLITFLLRQRCKREDVLKVHDMEEKLANELAQVMRGTIIPYFEDVEEEWRKENQPTEE